MQAINPDQAVPATSACVNNGGPVAASPHSAGAVIASQKPDPAMQMSTPAKVLLLGDSAAPKTATSAMHATMPPYPQRIRECSGRRECRCRTQAVVNRSTGK